MNAFPSVGTRHLLRSQAKRIADMVGQQEFGFHGALLGKRREGKTDLLRQVQFLLFEKAEGPIPFFYAFPTDLKDAALARHFVASFCTQVRAFLMRQEDLLQVPPSNVERELERAGLPLSLAEMTRNFLALTPAHQLDFAATLPAQFAHREDRPLCLLLDDLQVLDPAPLFFAALDSHNLCWLLSGRYPFVLQIAGEAGWPLVYVEPFSREEVLIQARNHCQAFGVQFSRQVWEQWCEMAGTSPWLISCLITTAAVRALPLNSIDDLGRVYVQELASGTLGNWLSARFEQAVPNRHDRAAVREYLAEFARTEIPPAMTAILPSNVWDGLLAEEWAEEDAPGPQILLDTVRRDWISLATVPAGELYERAKSRILQMFLLRTEQRKERPEAARFSTIVRQGILKLPQTGFPEFFSWEGQDIRFPKIISVSAETVSVGELFWCYGFYGENRESLESAVVLLIAVCDATPTDVQLQKWGRQLDSEARTVQSAQKGSPAADQTLPLFWVTVPAGMSLAPTGSECRFSWQTFFRLVMQAGAADPNPPSAVEEERS
ncbi:MAG: hypothetical protein HYX72_05230 [Acidobacteria bacterium]|nr:hypothetical protein [Acidobacteriota bacterium]